MCYYAADNSPVWYIGAHNPGTGAFNAINESDKNSKLSYINGAVNIGLTLSTNKILYTNQYLSSPNKKFIAKMQSDGSFVVYNSDSSLWSTQTDWLGNGTNILAVQDYGNIVLYDSVQGYIDYWNLWDRAGAWHDKATYLKMQNDGNLVAYDDNNIPIWWSGTAYQYGYSTFNIS